MTSSLESISLSQAFRALCCLDRRFEAMQVGGKSDGRIYFCFCLSRFQGPRRRWRWTRIFTSAYFATWIQHHRATLATWILLVSRCGRVLPDLDSLLASFEPTLRRWQRLPPEAIWVGDMEQHGTQSSMNLQGAGVRSFCELLVGTLRAERDEVRPLLHLSAECCVWRLRTCVCGSCMRRMRYHENL